MPPVSSAGIFIGYTFSLVIFFTDGFLRVKSESVSAAAPGVERFLTIASQFPMELQMVLCNRLFDSARNMVLSKHSEPGFLWLARPSLPWE